VGGRRTRRSLPGLPIPEAKFRRVCGSIWRAQQEQVGQGNGYRFGLLGAGEVGSW